MNFSGSVELKNQTFVLKNNKCMNITKRDCGNEILTAMVRAAGQIYFARHGQKLWPMDFDF